MALIWVKAIRDAPSDENLFIERHVFSDGSTVRKGDVILEVEGSKSIFEVTAPESGTLYLYQAEGESPAVGEFIACICTDGEEKPDHISPEPDNALSVAIPMGSERFSEAAIALVLRKGLDFNAVLPELEFVTESEVNQAFMEIDESRTPHEISLGRRIAILGGGHLATLAYEIAASDPSIRVVGVFDDNQNMMDTLGVQLLGGVNEFIDQFARDSFDQVVIAVQSNRKVRNYLINLCEENGVPFATLVHPKAFVSSLAVIQPGCIVMDGARIGPYAVLESNVFVSGLVNIDHHCQIGRNTTFGPGVFLSGNVKVGAECEFGTAIGIEPGVTIGARCVIASGAILNNDIPADHIVKVSKQIIVRPRKLL